MAAFNLHLNGKKITVESEPDTPLLWVIRDFVGLKGTKFGCGLAMCGACTVHLDGEAIRSCITPISALKKSAKLTTIEGLETDRTGLAVQAAWVEQQVPQCGYCQSGQIMAATAFLKSNSKPTDAEIDAAMSGNLCRCGTYSRIRAAIHQAAAALK